MENALETVYGASPGDAVRKVAATDTAGGNDVVDVEVQQATTARTVAAMQAIIRTAAPPANLVPHRRGGPTFIRYSRPVRSLAAERGWIIRMDETPLDPLEPPKHKHRRVPRAAGSPPVPVMSSPPRPPSMKDQQDWKVPPCVSNWKNPKGYTIPLDKRVAADGRALTDAQISAGFAGLAEALCAAEKKAREAVQLRRKVQKGLMMKEKERRERELRRLADKARSERADAAAAPSPAAGPSEGSKAKMERDVLREERRREKRLEARAAAATGKKSKVTRDSDRDVSERVALGMASTGGGAGGEVTYDERLFNQDRGLDSGITADDQYNVYSGRLFASQPALSALYRPNKRGDSGVYGDADEQLEKITKTDRFKPDKGFTGAPARAAGKRERPVEFDEPEENADPFDLDQFLTQVKKGKKHRSSL